MNFFVKKEDYESVDKIITLGVKIICIDIAHGHTQMMKNTVEWLRNRFGRDLFIMAGNVGTPQAIRDLDSWGVDAIKVGIGGGFVCETKNVTGVNTPMLVDKLNNVASVFLFLVIRTL